MDSDTIAKSVHMLSSEYNTMVQKSTDSVLMNNTRFNLLTLKSNLVIFFNNTILKVFLKK